MIKVWFCFRTIQKKLGGPSVSDYEKLHAEKSELETKKYNDSLAKQPCSLTELDGVKSLHSQNSSADDENRDAIEDKHIDHICG
ncbi:hypothetical protein Bca52824_018781 [Brassica carinata]|uniref:Uncharacterized protein n=1 Tax=Brassica carinata TaxID=52824 RepID=A0A8X7VQ53_BRACI|nr:hypothetical protein Bca52824_018781 [Brassica carinata]